MLRIEGEHRSLFTHLQGGAMASTVAVALATGAPWFENTSFYPALHSVVTMEPFFSSSDTYIYDACFSPKDVFTSCAGVID